MTRIKYNLLLATLFLVFTQGMWERMMQLTPSVSDLIDVVTLLLVLYQFRYGTKVPGSITFLIFLPLGFLIGLVNGNSLIDSFLYLRFPIFFYLIYNQLYHSNLSVNEWRKLLKLLFFMILIQGIGSFYNIFILGDRIEGYVGLMSSLGGTTATAFPLIVTSLALIFYFFKPHLLNRDRLIILLGLSSAFLVGYSSGKRAIYFILPIFFVLTYILSIKSLATHRSFHKKFFTVVLAGIFSIPLITFGIQNSRGINNGLSGNESNWQVLEKAFDYAQNYESSTDYQYGHTTGRSNTTSLLLNKTVSDPGLFLFGQGYGATKDDDAKFKLGYIYGLVGFTRDIVSGGWLLMAITSLLFIRVIVKGVKHKSKMPTVLRQLMLANFLFIHFFYSSDYTISLKIDFILLIFLALFNSPYNKKSATVIMKDFGII